jgi:hypothetical protein
MQTGLAAAFVLVTVFVGGCASNSPNVYLPSETMQLAEVRKASVTLRQTIAGNQTRCSAQDRRRAGWFWGQCDFRS